MNPKVGARKLCKTTRVHKCFPVGKEAELLAVLQGGLPTECGHSGVCSKAHKERWAIPEHGAQALRGQGTSRGSSPHSPGTLISWPLAELHPGAAGPCGPRYKLLIVQVTEEAWGTTWHVNVQDSFLDEVPFS